MASILHLSVTRWLQVASQGGGTMSMKPAVKQVLVKI
jgi:hypothetical protein